MDTAHRYYQFNWKNKQFIKKLLFLTRKKLNYKYCEACLCSKINFKLNKCHRTEVIERPWLLCHGTEMVKVPKLLIREPWSLCHGTEVINDETRDCTLRYLSELIIYAPSGIQTWDLTICLCLNLKHGELDHSATMAGS